MADAAITLPAPVDFSLVRSQKLVQIGYLDPCLRIEGDVVWRATRTPDGSATFRAARDRSELRIEAWGEGAGWIVEHASELSGLADDPHAFAPDHATLRRLHAAQPVYLPRTLRLFEYLVPTILHQLVTWREGMLAYRGIVEAHGEEAPGPGPVRLPPDASTLAKTPYYVLSEHGVLKRHSDTIRRAAKTIARLEPQPPQVLSKHLEAVHGIGRWTSQATLAGVLGDPDAVPTGDIHLPNDIAWALAREPRADDGRMLELLEPFRGNRWRVITLIRAAGIKAPRRGPRKGMQSRNRILGGRGR